MCLPAKFRAYLVNTNPALSPMLPELDAVFNTKTAIKPNIFDAGKYLFKGFRTDIVSTDDTHLYRLRKAEKVRAFIKKNQLEDAFIVPKKYIYLPEKHRDLLEAKKLNKWDLENFWVVSEKLDLDDDAVAESLEFEQGLGECGEQEGQAKKLIEAREGKRGPLKKVALTDRQVEGLAKLSFLGLTDLSYNNLFFTKDEKFAILDTEPQKRYIYKERFSSKFAKIFGSKSSIKLLNSITGCAKLKLFCTDEQKKIVSKIERNHALFHIAANVVKIAICILVCVFLPQLTASIGLAGFFATVTISALNTALGIKILNSFSNLIGISYIWRLSKLGEKDSTNLAVIQHLECQSAF